MNRLAVARARKTTRLLTILKIIRLYLKCGFIKQNIFCCRSPCCISAVGQGHIGQMGTLDRESFSQIDYAAGEKPADKISLPAILAKSRHIY